MDMLVVLGQNRTGWPTVEQGSVVGMDSSLRIEPFSVGKQAQAVSKALLSLGTKGRVDP